MSDDTNPTQESDGSTTQRGLAYGAIRGASFMVLAGVSFLAAFGTMPVAALPPSGSGVAGQTLLCNGSQATGLGRIMNFFMQSSFSLGLVGAVAMWQFQSVVEIVTFTRERKKQAKQQKQTIAAATASLLAIGPIMKYGGAAIGITFAQCIDFVPFL